LIPLSVSTHKEVPLRSFLTKPLQYQDHLVSDYNITQLLTVDNQSDEDDWESVTLLRILFLESDPTKLTK
jgi:hypothetical protein